MIYFHHPMAELALMRVAMLFVGLRPTLIFAAAMGLICYFIYAAALITSHWSPRFDERIYVKASWAAPRHLR